MNDPMHVVCGHCSSVVRLPRDRLNDHPRCPSCHAALLDGKPVLLTVANIDRHIERNDLPLVVDFWAPWCGPCLSMAPAFEQAAQAFAARCRFGKLNTQDEPAPAGRFAIRSIPTLIVFRGGREAARQTGAVGLTALSGWLESVLHQH